MFESIKEKALSKTAEARQNLAKSVAITASVMGVTTPELALADSGASMLTNIKTLLQGGIGFLGAAMIVFGAVTIGINVHGSAQGNGGAIASGVAVLIGGAIVSAAALYFGTIDVSWAS